MKNFNFIINDPEGIHARPAGLLIKEANKFTSKITIEKGGKTADAKRIFAVMGLAAKKGEQLSISVEGADEDAAAAAIESFLKENM